MAKKLTLLLTTALFLSGCTREVYLQPVPCVEGTCEKCPEVLDATPCPEIQAQTKTIQYQVIDVESAPMVYSPCQNSIKKKCRRVCKEVEVKTN